jgi:hypothetical protein
MGRCDITWASVTATSVNGSASFQTETEKPIQSSNDEENGSAKRKKETKNKGNRPKTMMVHGDGGVLATERVCIGAVAGGIAGGFTNVVLHPIDTIKTKLQTRGAASLYSGPFDVISKVRKIAVLHSRVLNLTMFRTFSLSYHVWHML